MSWNRTARQRSLLGMTTDAIGDRAAVEQITAWAEKGESRYVCFADVHMVVETHESAEFCAIVNGSSMTTPDGMPLVWALRMLGIPDATRTCGPDTMPKLLRAAEARDIPVGFFGGAPAVLEALLTHVRETYPALRVTYAHSPPFRAPTSDEDDEVVRAIKASGARMIFVGLGCPKQERWMAAHAGRIDAVMLGIGAAFDFLAGAVPRAPQFVQRAGLEWFARLLADPKRLWRRYLVQNPRFVVLLARQMLRSRSDARRILVIGQTPPPHGGQTLMIQRLLQGTYQHATLHHVGMEFSRRFDDLARIRLRKVAQPSIVVLKAIYARLRHGTDVLYYAPSGPSYLPMLRDIAILGSIRWMFDKTILHFHAAGTSELYERLSPPLRNLYRFAYFHPDIAIQLSPLNPDDGGALRARATHIVPNGIEDEYATLGCPVRTVRARCTILYVGMISESKGFAVLVDAIIALAAQGIRVDVHVVGQFASPAFEQAIRETIVAHHLEGWFTFHGVLLGAAKHAQFVQADIFCYPTFFESESFGLVVLEAMQFGLPVVATNWRGVPSLVRDGETGLLAPIRDSQRLADCLKVLVADPELRSRMGAAGRNTFLDDYTVETFYARMDDCFASLG